MKIFRRTPYFLKEVPHEFTLKSKQKPPSSFNTFMFIKKGFILATVSNQLLWVHYLYLDIYEGKPDCYKILTLILKIQHAHCRMSLKKLQTCLLLKKKLPFFWHLFIPSVVYVLRFRKVCETIKFEWNSCRSDCCSVIVKISFFTVFKGFARTKDCGNFAKGLLKKQANSIITKTDSETKPTTSKT